MIGSILEYSKNLNILYVEDDEGLLNEIKEILLSFFKEVKTASNGIEALEKYEYDKCDIVVTDIKMPKMDGIELAKKIKELNPDQEIIVISAYNDSDKLLSLIQIGISDFILKPLNSEQLLKVLYKVSKNITYKKIQEKYLIQQSKLATMGQMLDMIAHQWMQFMQILSMKTEMFQIENKRKQLSKEEIDNYIKYYKEQTKELTYTLNEFRSFFKEKQKQNISIQDITQGVLVLLRDYLLKNKIKLDISVPHKLVEIYPNEFKHVIINIIHNSIEAFIERNIEDRMIKIYFENNTLFIEDNAGGIQNIDKIFEPKFTTKKEGSGMGLYLSKIIMEKIGDISAQNTKEGAKFALTINS